MCSRFAPIHSDFLDRRLLLGLGFSFRYSWIVIAMDSQPSTTATTSSSSSPAVDAAAHRSCRCCNRRMSSIRYDKHTHCISYHVGMSLAQWMLGVVSAVLGPLSRWLRFCAIVGSLVSKGKEKSVTTSSSSSPLVPPSAPPSVVSQYYVDR